MIQCGRCQTVKTDGEFNPSQLRSGGWCIECLRVWHIARQGGPASRPCDNCGTAIEGSAKAVSRRRYCSRECKSQHRKFSLYGISQAVYAELLARQDGGCAICRAPSADVLGRRLVVDHDHATGAVRGLLCSACNSGLGHFADDLDRLRGAIKYLENPTV